MDKTEVSANGVACAADKLLMDAYKAMPAIIPEHHYREMEQSAFATLVAAHAIVAKLDEMETGLRKEISGLRESVDFLSKATAGL